MCVTLDILQWLEECEPTPWWSINDVFKSIFWFITVTYIKQALGNIEASTKPGKRPDMRKRSKKAD